MGTRRTPLSRVQRTHKSSPACGFISLVTAKALIRRTIHDPTSNGFRAAMVHEHFSWKTDCIATSNRADAVLLARLRSGHAPLLKAYTHLLDPAADPTCPLCKEEYALLYNMIFFSTIRSVQWKYAVFAMNWLFFNKKLSNFNLLDAPCIIRRS